jgi:hypothetical protein
MGKRSPGFERRPQDFYRTPWEAVRPLLPHLPSRCSFVEPCAGDGALVDHLKSVGHICVGACDIEPKRGDITRGSAFAVKWRAKNGLFITNPPWTREVMHPMIKHLCRQTPAWCLFDADWAHTVQSAALYPYLRKIVSVGRVQWIEGTGMSGKDNAAWYLFDGTRPQSFVEFHGRVG